MCGIAGIAGADLAPAEMGRTLRQMTSAIVYRGPDDEGYFVDDGIGLGMRRLSIIDVEGGKQPVHNEDGTIHLVCNGEIYNYRELRRVLEGLGHRFYTRSDTEAAVHAYEEYGHEFLTHLRGMFALALWDATNACLLLAVDRFGIKPLYYSARPEGLILGSEMKCLLASGLVPRESDFDALGQFFLLGFVAAPRTALAAIRKLPPGHLLLWSPPREVRVSRYWDVAPRVVDRSRTISATRSQLAGLLKDAVQSHMVSDVPVGAFLSGGVDSSTVVALMSECSPEPVKTFSIGFADRDHNELAQARIVAERFGTDHRELVVEPESVDLLPELAAHFDEPFADSSALPTYYVCKAAREFVKVALSGDGGDEFFVGYTTFRGLEVSRYMQLVPARVRQSLAALPSCFPLTSSAGWNDRVARFAKRTADSVLPPDKAYCSKITPYGLAVAWSVLSEEFRREMAQNDRRKVVYDCLAEYPAAGDSHPLERFLYSGLKLGLAGDMLVKVDRMSMANSLEVRVPLLDNVLAEFVATIPVEQRFPHWRLKGLLKDVMADKLPRSILRKPKHGFTVPITAWFRGDLAGFASDVLLSPEARGGGYFDTGRIGSLLRNHGEGRGDFGSAIWALLMFELWRRNLDSFGHTAS